ncbi:MAG: fatty acid CoA ligase FadD9, partial [Mycobacterium sp.]|nr:fatty acid CoA ligase FadD9 [Mycobacterium sp.]
MSNDERLREERDADTREARLERRIADLHSDDEQFAAAKPDEAVSAAANRPG